MDGPVFYTCSVSLCCVRLIVFLYLGLEILSAIVDCVCIHSWFFGNSNYLLRWVVFRTLLVYILHLNDIPRANQWDENSIGIEIGWICVLALEAFILGGIWVEMGNLWVLMSMGKVFWCSFRRFERWVVEYLDSRNGFLSNWYIYPLTVKDSNWAGSFISYSHRLIVYIRAFIIFMRSHNDGTLTWLIGLLPHLIYSSLIGCIVWYSVDI